MERRLIHAKNWHCATIYSATWFYLLLLTSLLASPLTYSCTPAFNLTNATPKALNKCLPQITQHTHRSLEHIHRNQYRNPIKTLDFFGITPGMTVVEIWPGSKGWYTEILAPIVRSSGHLYAAHFPKESSIAYYSQSHQSFLNKISKHPDIYDKVEVSQFNPPAHPLSAPPNSADMILTFRNVHNWIKAGKEKAFFTSFYQTLKPKGILGIVEHRGKEGMSREQISKSGYVPEQYVIDLAIQSGFKLVSRSEINANPKDIKRYPEGVWTLPPTLRLKDKEREKYLQIGESDRMTLKFIKKLP